MRMDEFFRRISTMKKIPKSRIVMQVPPSKEFRWENGEIDEKADWSLARIGIYNKILVTLVPSFPLAWLWEDPQWYEDFYMDLIVEELKKDQRGKSQGLYGQGLYLQELAERTTKPPPIKMTLRAFVRKYPEIFQVERNSNHGSASGLFRVRLNRALPFVTSDGAPPPNLTRKNKTGTEHTIGTMIPTNI